MQPADPLRDDPELVAVSEIVDGASFHFVPGEA
jgi:hypothetical protein